MNKILALLPPHVLGVPGSKKLHFTPGEPADPSGFVFFPMRGALTVMAGDDVPLGAALLDTTGAYNLLSAYEKTSYSLPLMCHVETEVYALPSRAVRQLADQIQEFKAALFKSHAVTEAEVARTITCNTMHPAQARLARWLARFSDASKDDLSISQQQLADLLGTTRTTVSQLYGEHRGVFTVSRGHLHILDKKALRERACSCYGIYRTSENSRPSQATGVQTSQEAAEM